MKYADKNAGIDLTLLQARYAYDPETGLFTHKVTRGNQKQGNKAGFLRKDGYIQIKVEGLPVLAHRLAWFYVHGVWPTEEIDHINRIKSDNRLCNLREASRTQNCINFWPRAKTSGARGVWFGFKKGKPVFVAHITCKRKMIYLGQYATLEEAKTARWVAESMILVRDSFSHKHLGTVAKVYVRAIGARPDMLDEVV